MEEAAWYIQFDGRKNGPYRTSQIRGRIEEGAIDGNTLIWCKQKGDDWVPISEIPLFADAITAPKRPKKERPKIVVTTADLKCEYDVIGPVYFQISNKGIFSSQLSVLLKQYREQIAEMKKSRQLNQERLDWGFLFGEWSVGQTDFDKAFFIAVEELKKRAAMLDADAVIGMRQDIDLDTDGWTYFYLQIYGTAVKFK